MMKILFINACVRSNSRTYQLAKNVLETMDGKVEEVNLEKENIQPLNSKTLEKREKYEKANDFSAPMFNYAKQFAEADEIVIAAPYWDLTFPSTVRIYFEAVTVNGVSFKYGNEGKSMGLCKAKRITYITTSGGSIGNYNFGYDYIKALAEQFYGITEAICYTAENLDIQGADVDAIMAEAIARIH